MKKVSSSKTNTAQLRREVQAEINSRKIVKTERVKMNQEERSLLNLVKRKENHKFSNALLVQEFGFKALNILK